MINDDPEPEGVSNGGTVDEVLPSSEDEDDMDEAVPSCGSVSPRRRLPMDVALVVLLFLATDESDHCCADGRMGIAGVRITRRMAVRWR